ncbi:hypothetical protein EVAR_47345_1 [Eumeta japonica]|uniref:Uncharacterized protein n=1 Tax=Eumeta variegata TaxID=151549 RepID=A0A4C1WSL3_EUMVA|nr:hypothetical protein EVAR_47345_1 [Eumeta japonica]
MCKASKKNIMKLADQSILAGFTPNSSSIVPVSSTRTTSTVLARRLKQVFLYRTIRVFLHIGAIRKLLHTDYRQGRRARPAGRTLSLGFLITSILTPIVLQSFYFRSRGSGLKPYGGPKQVGTTNDRSHRGDKNVRSRWLHVISETRAGSYCSWPKSTFLFQMQTALLATEPPPLAGIK